MLHLAERSPLAVSRRVRRIAAGLLACMLSAALLTPERARAQQWDDPVTIVDACLALAVPGHRPSCADKIINTITRQNNVGLVVFYYMLTNEQIYQALLEVLRRDVPPRVIIYADRSQIVSDDTARTRFGTLVYYGAMGWILPAVDANPPGIQHNKIVAAIRIEPVPHTPQRNWIATYVTGSYNLTYAAENNNYENMIFLETTLPETLEKLLQGSQEAFYLSETTFAATLLDYEFVGQNGVGCTDVQMQDIIRANTTYQGGFITSTYVCTGATSAKKR